MNLPAGTFNLEKTKDALYQWVKEVTTGIITENQIIWRNQGEPLPARPCVTLKIIDGPSPIARNGNLFRGGKNDPFTVGIQMDMVLSVQVFGNTKKGQSTALQLSIDLNSSLIRQSILDKLRKFDIGVQEVGKVRNLSAIEENDYEERAGFEITLGLVQNITDQPGIIKTVNAEIKALNPDGTVNVDEIKNLVLP